MPVIRQTLFAILLPAAANADVFVTDFTAIDGPGSASGVWKNVTSGVGLEIPIRLTQTGGAIKPTDGSSRTSTIDNSFPWQDVPFFPPFIPRGFDAFNPNYNGDHINIEVEGSASSVVTINFNAQIVDPVLNFTDVDLQSSLVFTDSFTIVGTSENIVPSTTEIRPDGTDVGDPFDQECAGSLQFSGTFTSLTFTMVNSAPMAPGNDDRTGFSVSTTTPPVPVSSTPDTITISTSDSNLTLRWPADTYTRIE